MGGRERWKVSLDSGRGQMGGSKPPPCEWDGLISGLGKALAGWDQNDSQ